MLYLPLNSEFLLTDQSWNSRDTSSNNWMTLSTQKWVSCYQVWSSWGMALWTSAASWLKSWWNYATISCWVYRPTNPSWSNRSFFEFAVQNVMHSQMAIVSWSSQLRVNLNWSGVNIWLYTWNSDWCLVTYVINNGTVTIYLNDWTSKYSWTHSNWWWGSWSISSQQWVNLFAPRNWINAWEAFNWYVSNLIVENKSRTADDVANYYNRSKANYWL